ncbi:MAG TPA: DUF559 domain-containing protein [Xanthobacteraceae bacterium]|nr:DUF559 domain-containing protein [Xanthobacteraceae bacterium]
MRSMPGEGVQKPMGLIVEIGGVTHGSARELAHDAERRLVLEPLGFHVMRVSNVDICDNLQGVLEAIHRHSSEA